MRSAFGRLKKGVWRRFVLPQEMFPNVALVKDLYNQRPVADSSPTASATMNTGVKSRNGTVNLDDAGAYEDCNAAAKAG